jgi:membrane fusion protein (multidrug efflux system)
VSEKLRDALRRVESRVQASGDPRVFGGLWIAIGLLVMLGVALFATADQPERVAAAGLDATAVPVRVYDIAARPRDDRAALSGVLRERRGIRLSSETEGRVLSVGAESLDAVEEGRVLVQIDPLRARVAVERAEAAVARTESELGLAETSLGRQQSLKERAVASESALDDASNRSRVARAAIREARATLDEARDALDKKTIRSPFAGVLRSFDVEQGEYVRVGQALGELLDLSTARILIGLTGRQVVHVKAGQSVELDVHAHPGERFEGSVLRVGAAASDDTKKFPIEIEVDNPERRLLPGMVARVHLAFPGSASRIVVPREAVRSEYGLDYVYVLEPDDGNVLRAHRRRVDARELAFEPTLLELAEGVLPGERIAASGVSRLRDGAIVRADSGGHGGAS